MTTPQLPPLPEQSMTHHITDEQIFAVADEHADGGHGPVGEPADWYGFEQKSLLECIRAVLALAAPQGEPVAAQCRFEGDAEWKPCTVAHHLLVQAHQKEWPHYETRALYTAPAPAVPSGWSITDNGDNSITVHGPGLGCTVSDVEEVARRVPSEVLYEFCRAMLTAAPTPPAQPAVPESAEAAADQAEPVHEFPQGFSVEHVGPWDAMTDDANAAARWVVKRNEAPHCSRSGDRVWTGPTMAVALEKACSALGIPFKQPAVPEDVARDAERYRWLRDFHIGDDPVSINLKAAKRPGLDSAIDAARAAEKGGA